MENCVYVVSACRWEEEEYISNMVAVFSTFQKALDYTNSEECIYYWGRFEDTENCDGWTEITRWKVR